MKKARRSSIWQKNLAFNIFIGFFLFILIMEFLLLGIFLDNILLEIDPDGAPEILVEQGLIYYFLVFFFLRFYMQTLPTFDIGQFLHLPVKRSKIAIFMQFRSLTSFFNFIPLIILLPFAIKYMSSEYDGLTAFIWFSAIFLFELTSNFLLLWIKRKSNKNGRVFIGLLVFFAAVIALEQFHVFSLSIITETYFESLQEQFALILIPIATLGIAFYLSYVYILKHSYLEDLPSRGDKSENISSHFNKLESFGKLGSLILNEIKLLLRNKRSKTILYMVPFFLLYGLFFYPNEIYRNSYGWLVFVGIFVTGGFMMAYGQYTLSWESRHFDFIQSNNISRVDFFTAKYFLITMPTVAMYFISIPYIFFGKEILLINTMALFYNLGINAPLLLFTASFNRKRMELTKGGAMNYQGVGINNFITIIPLLAIPAILFNVLNAVSTLEIALISFTGVGILGMIFHRYLIRSAVKFFEKNRYKISEGFRQN